MPNHNCYFYSVVPTVKDLPESLWNEQLSDGIDWNEELGVRLLKDFSDYAREYSALLKNGKFDVEGQNAFNHLDSLIYYCVIRYFKPNRIIEVGSGHSTKLASLGLEENKQGDIIAIEPYPKPFLKDGTIKRLRQLIQKSVQHVSTEFFNQLESNDILFIDSSHVSKVGSDVNYLYLHILPNIKKSGVIVHIHDISLPSEISKKLVRNLHYFWNESYLLHAFLIGNKYFEVLLGVQYMIRKHPEILRTLGQEIESKGGSFWMRKK